MSYTNILTEIKDAIEIITINRPNQLNALNKATIGELSDELKRAESDETIRVIILTGSGEKAFVAGADIKEFADFNVEQGRELSKQGQEKLFDLVENLGTPVIAAVNGFALGGGLELAMSAHLRIASSNAKLGLPEVSLGVIPGYGGTQRLPQLVGRGLANEMIFSAQMIDAEKAKLHGLVNDVVSPEELLATCEGIAQKISRNSPKAISLAIRAVNAGYQNGTDGYQAEIDAFGEAFGTEDFREGTTAFVEKRKAQFTGK
jgi:enoyl-CoA hydratase